MKVSPLLLTGSLIANAALVAVLCLRMPGGAESPGRGGAGGGTSGSGGMAADKKSGAGAASTRNSGEAANGALEASGPGADARDLALGRTLSKLIAQARTNRIADARWWTSKGSARNHESDLRAQRELSDAIVAAFGEDPLFGGRNDPSTLAFLPAAKRDALRRIVQDYDEMLAAFGASGVELASDREKQKLLRAEREHDIAALLSPEELVAYQMRTSSSGATIKSRFGDAIASEEEFGRLYALQKSFDERFPREALTGRLTTEILRARADAERQLQADMAAAIGTERFAALQRAADSEYRTLDALTTRLSLPAGTADSIVSTRDAYGAESQRINADASLTAQDRRQQIIDLAARARTDLTRLLGAEGAEAYLQRSSWVSLLQGGTAYSNTPPAGTATLGLSSSVFPVAPRGAAGNTSSTTMLRQVISTSGSGAAPTSDALIIGGGAPAAANPGAVMNFTSVGVGESISVSAAPALPVQPTAPSATGAVIEAMPKR